MDTGTSFDGFDRRYYSLRIVGAIFTLIGFMLLLLGAALLAFGLYGLATGSGAQSAPGENPMLAHARSTVVLPVLLGGVLPIIWSIGLIVAGLQCVALGAFVRLMIHIEENTRASTQLLKKIARRLEPSEEGVGSIFRA
ncbi:MAG: hypothetical protein ACLQIB_57600 [Isosphaeraceae bacterium]